MIQDTEVLIVGAGPVGLTLAIDLGQKGVRCILLERKQAPEFLPKMERCNARSMEIFRRMGIAGKIRAAGLAADVPMDVYIVLAMNEPRPWDGSAARLSGVLSQDPDRFGDQKPAEILVKAQSA